MLRLGTGDGAAFELSFEWIRFNQLSFLVLPSDADNRAPSWNLNSFGFAIDLEAIMLPRLLPSTSSRTTLADQCRRPW
jgi:hypothetical protein